MKNLKIEAFGRARFHQQLKKKGIDVNKQHSSNVKDAAAAKKRAADASKDHAAFRKKYPNIKFESEATTTADAGIPHDTKNMGPTYKAINMVDRRRKKDKSPILLKRFRKYMEDHG